MNRVVEQSRHVQGDSSPVNDLTDCSKPASGVDETLLAYLDAKRELDENSLNRLARAEFLSRIDTVPAVLKALDLGVGAGASLLRMLDAGSGRSLAVTAVDQDAALLAVAWDRAVAALRSINGEVELRPGAIVATQPTRSVQVRFIETDVGDYRPDPEAAGFDVVQAHQVMDLLPLTSTLRRIAGWLKSGGLFYATLNYDSGTTLFPPYRDAELEERILVLYDRSMEQRVSGAESCGGARSGRRLLGATLDAGLDVVAYGSSDWNLTPVSGRYLNGHAICLRAVLGWIHDEAKRSGELAEFDLSAWLENRLASLADGKLGVIIHQIDLLAVKPPV